MSNFLALIRAKPSPQVKSLIALLGQTSTQIEQWMHLEANAAGGRMYLPARFVMLIPPTKPAAKTASKP